MEPRKCTVSCIFRAENTYLNCPWLVGDPTAGKGLIPIKYRIDLMVIPDQSVVIDIRSIHPGEVIDETVENTAHKADGCRRSP